MLMLYFTIFKTYLAIINATVMIKYIVLKPHNTSRPRLTKNVVQYVEFSTGAYANVATILCVYYSGHVKYLPNCSEFCFQAFTIFRRYEHKCSKKLISVQLLFFQDMPATASTFQKDSTVFP